MAAKSKRGSSRAVGTAVIKHVEQMILLVRAQRVLLDEDLARMYGVSTGALVQAVKRNMERFPGDFMFQLDEKEAAALRSQTVISKGRGGRRYRPYVFTEQGVAMLSSVLRSPRAIAVNVQIMRAFVHLRQVLASNEHLRQKLEALERKFGDHDEKFAVIFEAIRQLMTEPQERPKPRIGYATEGPIQDRDG
ncbi:MAG TPA: ORF6N domain-containing protein [Tepidisphaeraceae bacterium]|jgi:hypothetical protein|nr:ORF6N domain-containing protein [Tepidisphaeraceae bacterium]